MFSIDRRFYFWKWNIPELKLLSEEIWFNAAEGDRFMRDEELVIGIAAGGEAKAYSTELLDSHEIVNDRMGGSAIAVTW